MYFGFYTCITKLIHVFQILHVYYETYTCLSTRRYYRAYTYFIDTRVPLGTIGLILVLPIWEYL